MAAPRFSRAKNLRGHEPLWELRREYDGIAYRIFFCTVTDEMWLLHAIEKKSRKTPHNDLGLAFKRMQNVLKKRFINPMKRKTSPFESDAFKRLAKDPELAQSFFEELRGKPVALQLKFIRRLKGVAQHDLAQGLHLKQAFISKLESNKQGHRLKTYERIAGYLKGNLVFLPKNAKIVF